MGKARATRINAAVQARATLQTVGNQKDRGKAEVKLLKQQAQTGKDRQALLNDQIVQRQTKIGGQKLTDAIDAFNLGFDGIKGGPLKKYTTSVMTNRLMQHRPNTNEG